MSSPVTPVLVDAATLRDKIYSKATDALQDAFKLQMPGRTLHVEDVTVSRREFSPEEQKMALLRGDSLRVPVKGTLVLKDAHGNVLNSAKNFTLVQLPWLTERHTVISDGNEYQFANQLRRKPGVYTQRSENGELKTVFNLGRGANFDLGFNAAKGTFAVQYGTSNIPLYAMLRGLGVPHSDIAHVLGHELAQANAVAQGKQVDAAINKLYENLVPSSMRVAGASTEQKAEAIHKRYALTTLDPEVTQHTLGRGHTSVTPHALLDAAKKLVKVNKGAEDVDDTDSLAFKTFHAVDDFLAERIRLGAREWAPKAKRALNGKTDLRQALHSSPLTQSINKFVTTSTLTAVPSGINPMELIDHAVKVTALGEGGIPSDRAIPYDARLTHETHFGALDPVRTPECHSSDTEVLTSTGWKLWPEVTEEDLLACRLNDQLTFCRPERVIHEVYKGPMYGLDTGKLNYLVTPNHRVWCCNAKDGLWQIVEAFAAHGNGVLFDTDLAMQEGRTVEASALDYFIETYDGMVHCATVPGGLLYVRRKGGVGHWSGNSNHAGVDVRATLFAHRDDKGNMYTVVRDVKTGKEVFLKAGDQRLHVIAFPHQKLTGRVMAFVKGVVQETDASKVTHQMMDVSHQYSPATALLPLIHNIQANRAIMGSKMGTQALPLIHREAPFLQVKGHLDHDTSFESIFGHMVVPAAPVSGTVEKIQGGYIYIRPHGTPKKAAARFEFPASIDPDSEDFEKTAASEAGLVKVPYQQNFPFPSKTFLHHTLDVKPGDTVTEGQRLGDSNYTRNGTLALGTNLRVAYVPYYGLNSNDAVVISEGASKKLTSQHMYREVFPLTSRIELSKGKHKAYYGNQVTPAQYAKLDDSGVIMPGSVVNPKDPLVLGLVKNEVQGADLMLGRISKSLVKPYKEQSLLWSHGTPGTVVDVVRTGSQIAILVKTEEQMTIGDKLCYDEETEVLTDSGWKSFHAVKMGDKVATLQDGELKYEIPSAKHVYQKGGEMYRLDTQQVDLFVTMDHNMWVRNPKEAGGAFAFKKARSIVGEHVEYKKDASWSGEDQSVDMGSLDVPADTYAMLLGAFTSAGCLVSDPASGCSYGIDVTPGTLSDRGALLTRLGELGLKFKTLDTKIRIYSRALYMHFAGLKDTHGHRGLPDFVFSWSKPTLLTLFQWLMHGDANAYRYTTTSARLAGDLQRLCLHIGYAANVHEQFDVRIVRPDASTAVNQHGRPSDSVVSNYERPVYCLTVPGGLLYVRRNGKPVWSGNCGRYGNKGVVSAIIPDHEMLRDEQGRPIDLLLTSAGVISRINPAQIIETSVGKVVEKTGKPIIYDNAQNHDASQWAADLLKQHGLKEKETLYDPKAKRHIYGSDKKGVTVGRQMIYKLFKSTDTNFAGHGVGPYDGNEQPLKQGGDEGAKGIGKMELDALIAHNARNILQENATIKSQKNDEFWRAIQLGTPLPAPKPTFAFRKFTAMLEGAGIKVDKRDSKFKLLAMTDRDVLANSRGAIENKKTLIAKNLKPEKGGLFDTRMTGGPQGTLYSHIDLHEPIPNPVFVEPVRRLLGMTQKQFEQNLAEHGGAWFRNELKTKVNVDAKLKELEAQLKLTKGPELDNVVKQIKYLRALKAENLKPEEAYIISKIPVIPPVFRPVLPDLRNPSEVSIGDANKLYGHLMDANATLKGTVMDSDLAKHRNIMFKAVGAVFGTHTAQDEKLQKQEVKGYLQNIAGVGTPKGGFFQRKLMRRTQDVSGRGTAVPDPNLGMDEVGIPEQMLWQMLDKLIVARLIRQGYGALAARELVDKKAPVARDALLAESKERPVLINRAPTLHRWSIIAAYPKLVKGKTIRVSPFIEKGMNLDFDGDQTLTTIVAKVASKPSQRLSLSSSLDYDRTKWHAISTSKEDDSMAKRLQELVPVRQDDSIYIIAIEDFPHKELEVSKGTRDFYNVEGVEVMTWDPSAQKWCWAAVSCWSVHRGCETEIVTLESGRQLFTDNDPRAVYGLDADSLELVRRTPSDACASQTWVPVSHGLVGASPAMSTIPGLQNEPVALDERLGRLVGTLIGDGHVTSDDYVALAALDDGIAHGWRMDLEALYPSGAVPEIHVYSREYDPTAPEKGFGDSRSHRVRDKAFGRWLRPLIGSGAANKHLPPFFLDAPEAFRRGLFAGLMQTDGCISISNAKAKAQWMINYSTISNRLARELQLLCRSLGVRASVTASTTNRGNRAYVITPSSVDLKSLGAVRIHDAKAQDMWDQFLSEPVGKVSPASAKFDKVPLPKALQLRLRPLFDSKGSMYQILTKGVKTGVTRAAAREILESRPELRDDGDALLVRWIALVDNTAVRWDRVESFERTGIIEDGYDLTVPGFETFMNIEGVVLSNTLQVHAPVQVGAVEDAKRMTLSNMVLSDQQRGKILAFPQHEAVIGLTLASSTAASGKPVQKFKTVEEAKAAWRAGKLNLNDRVEIAQTKTAAEEPDVQDAGLSTEDALFYYPVESVVPIEEDQ